VLQMHCPFPQTDAWGYQLDLEFIEAGRLSAHSTQLPEDLAEAYVVGVREERAVVFECLGSENSEPRFLCFLSSPCNLVGDLQLGRILS
jgi:hypothetical protein